MRKDRTDNRDLLLARKVVAVLLLLLLPPPSGLQAAPVTLSYAGSQRLPEIVIDGQPAVVHTQGLFVTATHWFVTGRLERGTRRALFLAFDRTSPDHYDVIDITPPAGPALAEDNGGAGRPRPASRLDHPGGFDSDGRAFWIPVAASQPGGPTAVIRLGHPAERPPSKWHWQIAFRVDDHIGALAWDIATGHLYGANWDTRRVYAWATDGQEHAVLARGEMVKAHPDWCLAVQDWKGVRNSRYFPSGTLVAGGIDKSPGRDAALSASVVEWLDPVHRKRLAQVRLVPAPDHPGTPTREGLAWYNDQLYLLPGDLGRGATILRYRCQR